MENYRTNSDYHIPTYFEKDNFKLDQAFRFRITQIYDPSKFWLVRRYRELEEFERVLFKHYYIHRTKYQIPKNKFVINLYCCCFCESGYHRGVVVGFPITYEEEQEVQVHFIDHGSVQVIEMKNVYYLDEKFLKVPQFAIRASLAGICPKNLTQWSVEDVEAFRKLVYDKVLIGLVVNINHERKLLDIQIAEEQNGAVTVYLHEVLVSQNRAVLLQDRREKTGGNEGLQPKLKYPYLFPSHEALESGKVPTTRSDAEYLEIFRSKTSYALRYFKK